MIITITNPKTNKNMKFVDVKSIDKFQNSNRGCSPFPIIPETQLYSNVFWMTKYPLGFDIMSDPANNYVSTWESNNSYFTTSSHSQSDQLRRFIIYFQSHGVGVDDSNNTTKIFNDVLVDCDDILLLLDIEDNFGTISSTRIRPFKLPIFNSGDLTLELDCPSGEFEVKYDLVQADMRYKGDFVYCEYCEVKPENCPLYYISQPMQDLVAEYTVDELGVVVVDLEVNLSSINWVFSNLPVGSRFEINFTKKIIKVNGENWTYKFEDYILPEIGYNTLLNISEPGILRTVVIRNWVHI